MAKNDVRERKSTAPFCARAAINYALKRRVPRNRGFRLPKYQLRQIITRTHRNHCASNLCTNKKV